MARREISPEHRTWLLQELVVWRKQDLVSSDQAGRIVEFYETPAEYGERQLRNAVFAVGFFVLGTLVVGFVIVLLSKLR